MQLPGRMTSDDVKAFFSIGQSTLQRMVASGLLHPTSRQNTYSFLGTEIASFLPERVQGRHVILLSTEEVQDRYGLAVSTLHHWTKEKIVEPVKWRYTPKSYWVYRYIDAEMELATKLPIIRGNVKFDLDDVATILGMNVYDVRECVRLRKLKLVSKSVEMVTTNELRRFIVARSYF